MEPLNGLNNKAYLNNIMAKAVSTWKVGNNAPRNANALKNFFWNQVKNRTLYYKNNINPEPRYIRVSNYNQKGKKFKESTLANSLQYKISV
jgi:hypothetical protein